MADYVPSKIVAKIAAILHATPLAEGHREPDLLVIVFNELGKQLYTKDDIARLLSEAPIVNSEHPVQKNIEQLANDFVKSSAPDPETPSEKLLDVSHKPRSKKNGQT